MSAGGILTLVLVILLVLIALIKINARNTTIKLEEIELDTKKSVDEIASLIRSLKCTIRRLNDPLNQDHPSTPSINVELVGEPRFTEKLKHVGGAASYWGVDITVFDMGDHRHVILTSLGQNTFSKDKDNKGFGMGFSREYRDKIAAMIS